MQDIVKDIDDAARIANDIEKGKTSKDVSIVRKVRQGDLNLNDRMKGKLFPFLRGPKEFFELIENQSMIPLDKIMDINRGITTGVNEFFYVKDITDGYTDEQLDNLYGIKKGQLKKIRVVEDGQGGPHLIEKEYLEPILKGPKEFTKMGNLVFNGTTKKYDLVCKYVQTVLCYSFSVIIIKSHFW